MNQIELHYQITRSTATLQSYRDWVKRSFKQSYAGVLMTVAVVFYAPASVAVVLFWHRHGAPLLLGLSSFVIGQGLLVAGLWRLWRYRQAHPWRPEPLAAPQDPAA